MSEKEDDQLLQDASTLLMFANVAAKQQQNHIFDTPDNQRVPGVVGINLANPQITSHPSQIQLSQASAIQNVPISPSANPLNQSQLPRLSSMPYYGYVQHISQSHMHGNSQYAQPQLQNLPHQNLNSNVINSPPVAPNQLLPLIHASSIQPLPTSLPHILLAPPPPTQNQLQQVLSPTNDKIFPRKMVKISPKQPVRRGSISLLMNDDPQHPPHLLLSKAEQTINVKQKSVSPSLTSAIVDSTHKRSQSHPEISIKSSAKGKLSPTTKQSNVSLLNRGINLKTGERDTSNAMIAAAALAAAAEVPFPFKHEPAQSQSEIIHTKPLNQPLQPAKQQPLIDQIKTAKKRSPVPRKASPLTKKPVAPKKESPILREEERKESQESVQQVQKSVLEIESEPKNQVVEVSEKVETKLSPNEEETEPEDEEKTDDEQEDVKRQEYNIPSFESYKAEPDSVLIECICGIEEDDGFTVQCDICYRWQHCNCMGFSDSEELPDIYKCYYCDKKKWGKFDPQECRQNTLNRLNPIKKDTLKRKHLGIDKPDEKKSNRSSVSNNSSNGNNDQQIAKKRKVSESSDRKDITDSSNKTRSLVLPIKDNELLNDGVSSESYQSVYYTLKENDYKRGSIRELLANVGTQFYNEFLKLLKSEQAKKNMFNIEIMTPQQFKAIKFAKIVLPNYQKYMSENFKNVINKTKKHNKFTIKVRPYSDNQKQKFNGISKLSLFISSNDELMIPENTPIIEYLGEIDLFENYAKDSINQYPIWGTTKPKVLKSTLMLHENLSVVLDSRFVGNESRFIRKACPAAANCRIKQIYIPETKSFKFIVVTSKDIILKSTEMDEELRLCWEWDPNHPILQLYEQNEKFELLPDKSKRALIAYVDNILYFVECGCSTSNFNTSCALFKVKKATAYLLRSTRKASSISNINLTKSKDELIFLQESKKFVSWDDRLKERANRIEFNLFVTTKDLNVDQKDIKPESMDESESLKQAEAKPEMLMKIPYRDQLLAKYKNKIPDTKENQVDDVGGESSNTEEKDVTKVLPFPIVSELSLKIESSIDEALKPIEAEIEGTLTGHEDVAKILKEEIPARVENIGIPTDDLKIASNDKLGQTKTDPVKEEKNELQNAPERKPQPTVVKKLSFADYKKKLK